MGRLVLAHHKSYHPYKAENIERVRRDEEEAQIQEAKEEGRLKLADSEARIDLLRKRAGIKAGSSKGKAQDTDEDIIPEAVRASLKDREAAGALVPKPEPHITKGGHINLFADLEDNERSLQDAISQASRKKGKKKEDDDAETDKGFRLAPSEADRTPWYTKTKDGVQPTLDQGRKSRDELNKSRHDPLTAIKTSLARSEPSNSNARTSMRPPPTIPSSSDPHSERLSRESQERQRAIELIARKKREKEEALRGSETPSTVAGGYGNYYNREDVEEARRRREENVRGWRGSVKGWDGKEGSGRRW